MRNRKRLTVSDEATENFWPSFTDLTSTIVLILFVLVVLAYIQNLISGKNLAAAKEQLSSSLARLSVSQQQIDKSEKKLLLLNSQIEAGQLQLKLSQQKVEEQQAAITESNRELGNLRTKLQGVAVLRVDLLNKVKNLIEAELSAANTKGGPLVAIADNGNIVINESLVFEYNSYTVKEQGRPLLNTLSRAFANLLGDNGVRENIDVVLVQGHTDERGSVAFNRDLSAKRANAVLDYMFEANKLLEQTYGSYFASSAYSEFRPVNTAKSETAYEQNRRIEISVVLKDANVRKIIDDYIQGLEPAVQAAPPSP